MRFLHPEYASWFLALPVALALWTVRRYLRVAFLADIGLGVRARSASRLWSWRSDWLALAAAVLALAALVTAAMQPQLRREWRVPQYEQRDLMIVLDRSVSMRARDVSPTRFSRAIAEIKAFLEEKPADIDRVALVGFSNAAVPISYFTRDIGSLFFYLDWIASDDRPQFGTDIGVALAVAQDVIKRDGLPTIKVVLVLSDGEDEGTTLQSSVNALRNAGSPIYTIGIGGNRPVEVEVPADSGDGMAGWTMAVTFQETTLRNLAASGGGRYYRSSTGRELLGAMHDLAVREQRQLGWTTNTEYRDLFSYALGLAGVAACALLLVL